jgi:hypothetical protein
MMFKAKVIAHSVNPIGKEIMSIEVEYPRVILPEFNTHTVLSKNTSSSRAIPFMIDRVKKPRTQDSPLSMLEIVSEDPYYPSHWGRNEPGMQGYTELTLQEIALCKTEYLFALGSCIRAASYMFNIGLHKQYCNRLVEPWAWTKQIITGTEWANFFALRTHHAAHPDFQRVAKMMYLAMRKSTPTSMEYGEWHLPYITDQERLSYTDDVLLTMSIARSARVSYTTQDALIAYENDVKLVQRLSDSEPKHMSPFMHQAQCVEPSYFLSHPEHRSNLFGWLQNRKLIAGENITVFEPTEAEILEWENDAV